MKGKVHVYYDDEGDFLEISIGKFENGVFNDLGDGIFERRDEASNKVIGFAIHNFKKRTKESKNIDFNLPFDIEINS